jgi:hypothetical protein
MTTLANLRAKLNGEIGVTTDAETTPWSTTVRNNAISDGYAELWRAGVWKPATQTIATVADQWVYALTSIRHLERAELLDSSNRVLESIAGTVRDDGSGAWELRLSGGTLAAGFNIRVRGWAAYKSTFSSDSDTDDLPAEHNRIPLLKAKAILYRAELATFVRYGERQAVPPEMNASAEVLLSIIAAAEREFAEEAQKLARLRPRGGQTKRV